MCSTYQSNINEKIWEIWFLLINMNKQLDKSKLVDLLDKYKKLIEKEENKLIDELTWMNFLYNIFYDKPY